MPSATIEPFVDAEFEGDVLEVAHNLTVLRGKPFTVSAYTHACQAIRKAKLLLFSIERDQPDRRCVSADQLLDLSEEAVGIAEKAEPKIPTSLKAEFDDVKNGLRRHAIELRNHLYRKWR